MRDVEGTVTRPRPHNNAVAEVVRLLRYSFHETTFPFLMKRKKIKDVSRLSGSCFWKLYFSLCEWCSLELWPAHVAVHNSPDKGTCFKTERWRAGTRKLDKTFQDNVRRKGVRRSYSCGPVTRVGLLAEGAVICLLFCLWLPGCCKGHN